MSRRGDQTTSFSRCGQVDTLNCEIHSHAESNDQCRLRERKCAQVKRLRKDCPKEHYCLRVPESEQHAGKKSTSAPPVRRASR